MCDFDLQIDFDIKGLSLIDVTSEDDCLIDSPLRDDISPQFSGPFDEHGKLEGDETRGKGRYNLRKSLTWDSAFFSSAAFLEPEECTNTLESNENGEIHTLPGVQEDVDYYSDSSTMLDGEASTLQNSFVKKELETKDPKNVSSLKKLEYTNHDKVKQKAARKKPNLAVKVPVKTLKQVPARSQTSQSSRSGKSTTSSLHKPPKGLSIVGPISATHTRRASLDGLNCKIEKDTKSVTGKGTTVLKTPPGPASSTGATKIAAEGKSRVGRSQVSTFLKSPTNLNKSMSVASSYGEWSSDTSLSQSTSNKRSNIVRAGLGSGSRKVTVRNSYPEQVLDGSTGSEVTGSLDESTGVHSASIKPSCLRPPSPKLGYPNGVRLPGHTRTRSMDSYPIMPKIRLRSNSPSTYSNKIPTRTTTTKERLPGDTRNQSMDSYAIMPKIGPRSSSPSAYSNKIPTRTTTTKERLPGHTRTRSLDSYPIMPKIGPRSNSPSTYSNKIPTRTTTTKERLPGDTRTQSMESYAIMPKIGPRSGSPSAYSNKIPTRTTTTKERLPGHTRTQSLDSYPIMPKIGPRSNSPSTYSNKIPTRTTTTKERLPGDTRTQSMDSYAIMPKIGPRSNSPSAYSNKIPTRTTTTKERLPGHTGTQSMDSYPLMPKIGPRSNSPSAYSNKIPTRTTKTKERLPGHTRTRSMDSFPVMPKIGLRSNSPSAYSNKTPPRTTTTKVLNASRNPKIKTGIITPKHQNKSSPKPKKGSYSKAQGIGSAEKLASRDIPKVVVKLGGKGDRIKDTKIVPLGAPDRY